jgi:hypothetical protein
MKFLLNDFEIFINYINFEAADQNLIEVRLVHDLLLPLNITLYFVVILSEIHVCILYLVNQRQGA